MCVPWEHHPFGNEYNLFADIDDRGLVMERNDFQEDKDWLTQMRVKEHDINGMMIGFTIWWVCLCTISNLCKIFLKFFHTFLCRMTNFVGNVLGMSRTVLDMAKRCETWWPKPNVLTFFVFCEEVMCHNIYQSRCMQLFCAERKCLKNISISLYESVLATCKFANSSSISIPKW